MTPILALKLFALVTSVGLAAGLLARDHGLRANRQIALFLGFNALWALLEFFLYRTDDPQTALALYRAMTLAWVPLGGLCAHASVTLSALDRHPVRRVLPTCYAAIGVLVPVAFATDWVIADARPTAYGWSPVFGPGMLVAYLLLVLPLLWVLGSWRSLLGAAESGGQLLLARIVFFGIAGAFVSGTLTAIVLPLLGVEAFGLTTTLIAGVGAAVAWTLRRFGHSLIAPEAFAREILDTLDDGVILIGFDGRLRDANRAFLRLAGETDQAAIGRPVDVWIPTLGVDREGGEATRLAELRPRVGSKVPIVISPPVDFVGRGRVVGRAHVVRDRREVVSLQRQLIVSARLAAVGDLSKSIARAINDPIARMRDEFAGLDLDWQSLRDAVELVGVEAPCAEALDEGRELLGECVEGVDRIYEIVRQVAGFSSEAEREAFAVHSLDQIVRRSVRIARVQAPADLDLEVRLDPDVRVHCHFGDVERVVTNLLVNAIQALDGNPPVRRHVVVAVAAQDGRALLHVEDDGCGIDGDVLDRIFDPFFTTKPVGKGTGLGLAISYHIVKAHGGEIRVSSVLGRGTSVAVELPRIVEED